MSKIYSQKVDKLPAEIKDYLLADFGFTLENMIMEKYHISQDKNNVVGDVISSIFFKELELRDLIKKLVELLKINEKDAKEIAIDIIGSRFLILKDYFNGEAEEILKELGGNPEDYKDVLKAWPDELLKEKLGDEYYDLEEKKEKPLDKPKKFDEKQEEKDSLEVFASMLSYLLADHKNSYLEEFNRTLIILLSEKKNFKKELENALYHNGELFTHAEFVLDDKPQSPSIGNWIQDFIKEVGTGYVNNLQITKYITDSDNARRLSAEEKKLVQKLIQLYRNLKFFPDSLKDVPPEKWEIIPSSKESNEPRQSIGIPKTKEEKDIDELKAEEEKYGESSLEKMALEEEVSRKKHLEDLKIEIKKYKEGSLEWMAINDEIRRLGKK